jgi:hypothetical protein
LLLLLLLLLQKQGFFNHVKEADLAADPDARDDVAQGGGGGGGAVDLGGRVAGRIVGGEG